MTIEETIEKLKFMKRAYQELRDASITDGIVSGNAGEIKGEWHSDGHVLEAYQKHIDALEMAIKALEQEPKWTPVSEGLPKKKMKCLVTDSLKQVNKATFYPALDGRESYFSGCYCGVRAWMPLPKPYQKGGE